MRTSRLFAAFGFVALALLAGCGGLGGGTQTATPGPTLELSPSETPTRTPTATPTVAANETGTPTGPRQLPPSAAGTVQGERFLEFMINRNVVVTGIGTRDGSFRVEYLANTESRGAVNRQAGEVSAIYGHLVNETWRADEGTWAADRMDAVAIREDGRPVARYRVPAYWGRQLFTTEISPEVYGNRIARTLEYANANGSFPERTDHLPAFRGRLERAANVRAVSVSRSGRTAFVTARPRSGSDFRVARVVGAYATTVEDGWNATTLELAVQRPDGDLVGWYRISAENATAAMNGSDAAERAINDGFVPEDDRLGL